MGAGLLFTFPKKTPLTAFADITYNITREPFRDNTDAPECCIGAMNDVDHLAPKSLTVKMNKERHYKSSQTTFVQKSATDGTNAAVKVQNKRQVAQEERLSFPDIDDDNPPRDAMAPKRRCRATSCSNQPDTRRLCVNTWRADRKPKTCSSVRPHTLREEMILIAMVSAERAAGSSPGPRLHLPSPFCWPTLIGEGGPKATIKGPGTARKGPQTNWQKGHSGKHYKPGKGFRNPPP